MSNGTKKTSIRSKDETKGVLEMKVSMRSKS